MKVEINMKNIICSTILLLGTVSYAHAQNDTTTYEANLDFLAANQLEAEIKLNKAYDKYEEIIQKFSSSHAASLSHIKLNELTRQVFRNGIKVNNEKYPQDSNVSLLTSVNKAVSTKDSPYFFAHLYIKSNQPVFYSGMEEEEFNKEVKELLKIEPRDFERFISEITAIIDTLNSDTTAENKLFDLSLNDCNNQAGNTCYKYNLKQGPTYTVVEQNGRFYLTE